MCEWFQLTFYAAICTENGITYQEGDVWNPYFSKFGVIKCQICTCEVCTVFSEILPLCLYNYMYHD